jgi:hypothetical protein
MDFSKFNQLFDVEGLKKGLTEAAEKGTYEKTPHGEYFVHISKLELKESSKGNPMLSVWFEILEGEHKKKFIFMNQTITEAFQLHICNEFLRSLDSGCEVVFDDFEQYGNLIELIRCKIEASHLTYALEYGEKKGYDTFKIKEVFEEEIPL